MRPSRKRMPMKLRVMVEARSDQPCAPTSCDTTPSKGLLHSADVSGRRHFALSSFRFFGFGFGLLMTRAAEASCT